MADTEQHKCREEFHRHLPSSHRFVADVDGGDKDGDGGDEDGDGDDGGDKYMVMLKMVMMVSTVSWFGISLISTLAVPSILIDFPTICNDFHILTNLYFKPVRGSFP